LTRESVSTRRQSIFTHGFTGSGRVAGWCPPLHTGPYWSGSHVFNLFFIIAPWPHVLGIT